MYASVPVLHGCARPAALHMRRRARSGGAAAWSSGRSRSGAARQSRCRPSSSPSQDSREAQQLERETAANLWQEHGVVFAQENGRPVDPRADWQEWSDILAGAGIPHAVEEIARLAGHSSSRTTEVVYRHELRPALTAGAEVMDGIFG